MMPPLKSPQASARRVSAGFAAAAAATAVADTASKQLAIAALARGQRRGPFYLLDNPEFSLGTFSSTHVLMTSMMAAGILALLIVAAHAVRTHPRATLFLAAAVGGSISNALDRAPDGKVTDFLVLGTVVINVADIAVVVGLVGALAFWQLEGHWAGSSSPAS